MIATLLRRLADVSRPPTKKACLTAIDALFGGIMLVALAFGKLLVGGLGNQQLKVSKS